VIALDARVRIASFEGARGGRLAIRPYPSELVHTEHIEGIGNVLLRPVRPEDAEAFLSAFQRLSGEDVRMRFLAPLKSLSPSLLARLTQIDYDREMAFVMFSDEDVIAVGRLAADPDNRKAEFAVLVRTDLKGRGLGTLMLKHLIEYAKTRGIGELFGDVVEDNTMMLSLCRDFGCTVGPASQGIVRVSLALV